jgi:hypothetical protein
MKLSQSKKKYNYIAGAEENLTMNETQIRQFLERYGTTLSAGDLPGISNSWEVPALVLSDEGAILVADKREIEKFFAQAMESYRSRGLMSTKPEIERVEQLSEKLASVDVRWLAFDASGKEKSSERSYYLLQRGQDGQMYIRVALTRTM